MWHAGCHGFLAKILFRKEFVMATISNSDPIVHDPRIHDYDHPVWLTAFQYPVRHALVDQDLEAGRNVSRILLAIVIGGLLLGMVGVVAALLTL
jgi:hypothetical protein